MQTDTLLFEIGSEELPPKSLMKLANSLADNLKSELSDAKLAFKSVDVYATPRRLAVAVNGLESQQADRNVEKLGPAVAAAFDDNGNPKPAAIGFAKSCGVDVSELQQLETPKGIRLGLQIQEKGQALSELLPNMLKTACDKLPIPKPMRWGNRTVQFIRPVHWLVCMYGSEVVPVELFDRKASNQTFGHRFHHPEAITFAHADDYQEKLSQAHVVASFSDRKQMISEQANAIAHELDAQLVLDNDLHEEVTALVEWPVALSGSFDEEFLSVPAEALVSSMAEHQKYFHLLDSQGKLLNKFITVANIESSNPNSIIEGNEKVIRPRLADAKFFYDTDSKHPLSSHIKKLKTIVFQDKLGTVYDKTQRVAKVAEFVATTIGSEASLSVRAAELCKCDLMSEMVYEFPDLQGIMGRYYAINDGEHCDVAAAMDEVYMPRFAGDQLPSTSVGQSVAIADRIDTLVGIFAIGQIPTGAKDPFALRRAALGVLRIIIECNLTALDINELVDTSLATFNDISVAEETKARLIEFFTARLQAWYQEHGIKLPVLHSVLSLQLTNPSDIAKRIDAVSEFSKSEAAESLSAANKRVGNILSKNNVDVTQVKVDSALLTESQEIALAKSVSELADEVKSLIANSDYSAALNKLSALKEDVDAFFDNVMVMAEDEAVRNNRFALLASLRALFIDIADISLLQQ